MSEGQMGEGTDGKGADGVMEKQRIFTRGLSCHG